MLWIRTLRIHGLPSIDPKKYLKYNQRGVVKKEDRKDFCLLDLRLLYKNSDIRIDDYILKLRNNEVFIGPETILTDKKPASDQTGGELWTQLYFDTHLDGMMYYGGEVIPQNKIPIIVVYKIKQMNFIIESPNNGNEGIVISKNNTENFIMNKDGIKLYVVYNIELMVYSCMYVIQMKNGKVSHVKFNGQEAKTTRADEFKKLIESLREQNVHIDEKNMIKVLQEIQKSNSGSG